MQQQGLWPDSFQSKDRIEFEKDETKDIIFCG